MKNIILLFTSIIAVSSIKHPMAYNYKQDYMTAYKEGFTAGATKCRPLSHDSVPISSM